MLRGISIIFVMIQHYGPPLPVPAWYYHLTDIASFKSGVDLFFVISGFVISKSLAGRSQGAAFRIDRRAFGNFWIRRTFRLMPAAWLWAALTVASSFFIASMDSMRPVLVLKGALAGMFGYSNALWTYCLLSHGIGTSCPNVFSTSIYWSLSLEEQFYIVLSGLLLIVPFRFTVLLGIVSALLFGFFSQPYSVYLYFFRFGAMVVGASLYWLTTTRGYKRSWILVRSPAVRWILLAASILTIAFATSIAREHVIPLVAAAGGIAVWIASFDVTIPSSKVATAFQWVGDRSYSLYLCHLPMYAVLREVMMRSGAKPYWTSGAMILLTIPAAFAVCVFMSDLTYRFVERPFAELGRQIAARQRAKLSALPGQRATTTQ